MDTPSNRFCAWCASLIPEGAVVCPFCGSRQDTVRIWIDTKRRTSLFPAVTIASLSGQGTDPLVGTVFDRRYRILEVIGRGGMATVYLARQLCLKRIVALKVFHTQYYEAQKIDLHFKNEAHAMSQVRHPHIVSVYEVGQCDGSPYIAMNYIEGDSLKQLIQKRGSLGWQKACEIAVQVGNALQHVHDRNFIHGDVKPENILITQGSDNRNHVVKILDFGTSKPRVTPVPPAPGAQDLPAGAVDRTWLEIVGTPEYMAPEQLEGRETDARSDVYSLGVVLYLMLTGGLPSRSKGNRSCFVMNSIRKSNKGSGAVDPRLVKVPDDLGCLVMSMLEEDPGDRPQTMREVVDTLRGVTRLTAAFKLPLSYLPSAPAGLGGGEPETLGPDDTLDISIRSSIPPSRFA